MRRLLVLVGIAASSHAWADDEVPSMEAGLFGGGFISNYFHQFYEYDKFPDGNRPLLGRVSPELGLRYAYFFHRYIGAEVEASMIVASTQGMDLAGTGTSQSAQIYNLHVQAIFQYPLPDLRLYPFVALGDGLMHTSSDYLGSDTDWPIHVGAGVRFYATPAIAVRADLRFLRGASLQAPYTLNASYGEFMVGVSWTPSARAPGPAGDHHEAPIVDGDRDGDGILDSKDKCPDEPEDKDLYDDDDGCPDPDNDGDGIPDAQDKCPSEPETINGNQDDDGCPDAGDPLVILSPDRLDMLDAINFKRTAIAKQSLNVLGQVAATLRAHPEILRLRLTVYVQPTNDPDKDMDLSQKRAQVLEDWLVQWGIDAKRLEPRGFGGTKPLVPPDTKGARAINDRVELIILERK